MSFKPLRFIAEPIEVRFTHPPTLEKKPGCPDDFVWQGETYKIVEILSEWHDYHRRGRMSRNMQPTHTKVAEGRGSWGVGQDYYRISTQSGRFFEIYYDRAPKDIQHRKGSWFLYRELEKITNKAD